MSTQKILEAVQSWFNQDKHIGLKLPSGWFGRPYDNHHQLTFSTSRPHKLILELDQQLYLIFTEPEGAYIEDDELVITGFKQLVFDRQGYGDMQCHAEVFSAGEVRFPLAW